MNDNGDKLKKEPEKTQEQLLAERLERYKKEPGTFIELDDVVLMAFRNPKSSVGISTLVGKCKRSTLAVAQAELMHQIYKVRLNMDIEASMKHAASKNLITPGGQDRGGIMRLARKHFGGKHE